MLTLRHNLIFLVNNLHYYLQVDVIEAEFSLLNQKLKNANEFEDIIKLHSQFMSNLLSKTFLMPAQGVSVEYLLAQVYSRALLRRLPVIKVSTVCTSCRPWISKGEIWYDVHWFNYRIRKNICYILGARDYIKPVEVVWWFLYIRKYLGRRTRHCRIGELEGAMWHNNWHFVAAPVQHSPKSVQSPPPATVKPVGFQ